MGHIKVPLTLSALVIALAACCCPLVGLVGGTRFTGGHFADVPAYPDATQTTGSNPTIDGMVASFSLFAGEAEWKHYATRDSESDVLGWYQDELPDHGWTDVSGGNQDQGGLLFARGDVTLVVFAISGVDDTRDTHIILGRLETAD